MFFLTAIGKTFIINIWWTVTTSFSNLSVFSIHYSIFNILFVFVNGLSKAINSTLSSPMTKWTSVMHTYANLYEPKYKKIHDFLLKLFCRKIAKFLVCGYELRASKIPIRFISPQNEATFQNCFGWKKRKKNKIWLF